MALSGRRYVRLWRAGLRAVRAVRISTRYEEISVGEVDGETSWSRVFDEGIDGVVHLAAKVPLAEKEKKQPIHITG